MQLPRALRVGSRELGLRNEGFPFVLRRLNLLRARAPLEFGELGRCEIPAWVQLGRVELDEDLPSEETVALLRMNPLDAAAVARCDADLVGFDRPRHA